MPIDSAARAAVLATALASTALPESIVERQLKVPAIRLVIPAHRPPLDLNAPIFRYRIRIDGSVIVVDEPVGARSCVEFHRGLLSRRPLRPPAG